MERFTLTALLKRRWLLIVIITLIVAATAWWVDSSRKPVRYYGTFSVNVQATRNYPKTDQLILQGVLSEDLQTAIATTQTWLVDPFYVSKALTEAGVDTTKLSLKDYAKRFRVVSPVALSGSYQVEYVGDTEAEVTAVSSQMHNVLDEANENYQAKGGDLKIFLSYTDTLVTTKSSGLPIVPIAGIVIGLVFAFVIAAGYDRSSRTA